jgi:hypothetical protein
VGGLLGGGAAALGRLWWSGWGGDGTPGAPPTPALTAYEDLMGCLYTPAWRAPLGAVAVRLIPVPDFPGRSAVWGATGRDHRGHIWFGVSAGGVRQPSAHLFEYDPAGDVLRDRGDVLGELRRCGRARPGEGQMKIHSRIVQGEDGHLYFASLDEEGGRADGSRLPTWGSHLWRLRLPECRWEHLLSAPEGLIAVAGSGRRIQALGFFNHVLYQYDCRTGASRSVPVGSVGGHVSRNFFCDARGHVYVPRLRPEPGDRGMRTTLVELDPELGEVAETPLAFYTQTRDDDSHGLVGVQPLADRSVAFVTDQGFLYRVVPQEGKPAEVQWLGWFHPRGRSYVASLFTSDGRRHLMGLSVRETPEGRQYGWLVHDLATRTSSVEPVTLPTLNGQALQAPLLYGSVTRDNGGRCYLGGTCEQNGRAEPLLLQVRSAV